MSIWQMDRREMKQQLLSDDVMEKRCSQGRWKQHSSLNDVNRMHLLQERSDSPMNEKFEY
jgi:hypothetical protein